MRALMARLRGTVAPHLVFVVPEVTLDDDPRPYSDAVYEAFDQCVKLGLDVDPAADYDASELIRYVYAQGWLACESRLAAPNMADAIDLALTTPAAVVEQLAGESLHRWIIRAVQHAVAHGATSERKTAV